MMESVSERLSSLGFVLPEATAPVANYVPYQIVGSLVHISGQLPFRDGVLLYPGRVPEDVSVEEAAEAAQMCGLHLLAQLQSACQGDWERVVRCVKLGGFVQSSKEGFGQHPEVINGASNLMVDVFGESGRHARFAVGSSTLPRNACVEIDGVFEIRA